MLSPGPWSTDLLSPGPPVKSLLKEARIPAASQQPLRTEFLRAGRAQESIGWEPESGPFAARTASQPWLQFGFLMVFFFFPSSSLLRQEMM